MIILAQTGDSVRLTPKTGTKSGLAKLFDDDEEEECDTEVRESPLALAEKQMNSYLTLLNQQARLTFDDDPLAWWSAHKNLYPDLAVLARKYLSIQATSCASERLFSKAGYIVNKFRSRLHTTNVCMLTFMATNSDVSVD